MGIFEREPFISKTLKILEILRNNGVDVSKINMIVRRDGTRRSLLLKEIDQPGIDIMKIIKEYDLNPNENIGGKIAIINQIYKGTKENPITDEEKRKAEELGIIRNRLTRKENEQQKLQDKLKKAESLKDTAQKVVEETQNSK